MGSFLSLIESPAEWTGAGSGQARRWPTSPSGSPECKPSIVWFHLAYRTRHWAGSHVSKIVAPIRWPFWHRYVPKRYYVPRTPLLTSTSIQSSFNQLPNVIEISEIVCFREWELYVPPCPWVILVYLIIHFYARRWTPWSQQYSRFRARNLPIPHPIIHPLRLVMVCPPLYRRRSCGSVTKSSI